MGARKKDDIPRLYIKKGDSLRTISAKARRAFTAADLQRYTEEEEMVPADQFLADLEAELNAMENGAAKKGRLKPKKKKT